MIAVPEVERSDSAVARLLETTLLEVVGQELTGRDLLAAGIVSGRWPELETQLSEGLGLVAADPPPAPETRREVQAFRVAHKLLSADDMRAWLGSRELRMSDVNAAAERTVARRRGGSPVTATPGARAAALAAEAIWSGALLEIGWWLADRILVASTRDVPVAPIALEDRRIQRLVFEEAGTLAGATLGEPGLRRGERLAWIAALDDGHRDWERNVTDPREVARVLREHEFDWSRIELEELRLTFPGAAAEAGRQLAEGTAPAEVAATAGGRVDVQRLVLADAPSVLSRLIASAVAGDVVGPWEEGDEHVVGRVRARTAPSTDDEELLVRARQELMVEATARLRAGKVTWHERA